MKEDLTLTLAYQKDILIKKALKKHKDNLSAAARELGISRRKLEYTVIRFKKEQNEKII